MTPEELARIDVAAAIARGASLGQPRGPAELDAAEWFARLAADHVGDVEFEQTFRPGEYAASGVGVRVRCACGWRGDELRFTPSRARLDHVAHVVTVASVARARLESEADS